MISNLEDYENYYDTDDHDTDDDDNYQYEYEDTEKEESNPKKFLNEFKGFLKISTKFRSASDNKKGKNLLSQYSMKDLKYSNQTNEYTCTVFCE